MKFCVEDSRRIAEMTLSARTALNAFRQYCGIEYPFSTLDGVTDHTDEMLEYHNERDNHRIRVSREQKSKGSTADEVEVG